MQTETDEEAREWMIAIRQQQIEAQREKLNYALSELAKDYDSVEVRRRGEKHAVVIEWATLVVLILVFQCFIHILIEGKHSTAYSIVPGVIIQGVCLFVYFGLLGKCVHHTFSFCFRCQVKENAYANREWINTYPREESYLFSCMQTIREHLRTLDRMELELKRYGDLNEEQQRFVGNPTLTKRPPYPYTNESVWLFEWLFKRK